MDMNEHAQMSNDALPVLPQLNDDKPKPKGLLKDDQNYESEPEEETQVVDLNNKLSQETHEESQDLILPRKPSPQKSNHSLLLMDIFSQVVIRKGLNVSRNRRNL